MLGVKGALTRQDEALLNLRTRRTEMEQWLEEKVHNIVQACATNEKKSKEQINQYKVSNEQ